jgi:hypothetical protein
MNVRERSLLKERAGSLFEGIERSLLEAGVLSHYTESTLCNSWPIPCHTPFLSSLKSDTSEM